MVKGEEKEEKVASLILLLTKLIFVDKKNELFTFPNQNSIIH